MAWERTRQSKSVTRGEKLKGREAILAVLARTADVSKFSARLVDNPGETLSEYYTLTQEELVALTSGDIEKIESWVSRLDKQHAIWLWHRLRQRSTRLSSE